MSRPIASSYTAISSEGGFACPGGIAPPDLQPVELEVVGEEEAEMVLSHLAHLDSQRLHLVLIHDGRHDVEVRPIPGSAGLVDVHEPSHGRRG
jgi:hypothetical protein